MILRHWFTRMSSHKHNMLCKINHFLFLLVKLPLAVALSFGLTKIVSFGAHLLLNNGHHKITVGHIAHETVVDVIGNC